MMLHATPGAAGVALREFSVRFPTFRLEPLSLTFGAGERVALVGPNGAGKSTTIKAIAGRLPDYEGEVLIDGVEVRSALPGIRARVGVLPETVALYPWMTVREHFAFLAKIYPTWDGAYLDELVARLGLDWRAKVGTLSKGTRVKLAFAAAEAFRPAVLLLDEPTSGLDPVVRGEVLGAVAQAVPRAGARLMIFSTHLLEDIEAVADRVVVLSGGRLVADTSVAVLRRSAPGHSVAKALYDLLAGDDAPRALRRPTAS